MIALILQRELEIGDEDDDFEPVHIVREASDDCFLTWCGLVLTPDESSLLDPDESPDEDDCPRCRAAIQSHRMRSHR